MAAEITTPAQAEALFHSGKYEEAIAACNKAIEAGSSLEAWRLVKIDAQMAIGEYALALKSLNQALVDHPQSIMLRFQGRLVCLHNNQPERAAMLMAEIETLVVNGAARYSDASSRLMLGRWFLARNEDARKVLELLYDRVRKEQPTNVEAFIATADLALGKQDDALAAEMLAGALKLAPTRADIHYRLAQAYAEGDAAKSAEALAKALELNPRHVDSLLFEADKLIDAEQNEQAAKTLDRVDKINPRHPLAFAYRAVLAHLDGDSEAEKRHREKALATWPTNPEVDHTIGRKLSHEYRFREGAAYQRRALTFDPTYVPAKAQLSQDLLRLGKEEEGWRLAKEVFDADAYHVVAHNLLQLNDRLSKYATLEADGFVLRMEAREAELYGAAALDLLKRARAALCEKYSVELTEPVIVEIFAEQKDFAIRTFGLPGGAGFLGVCFGNVVTANSPASQGESPSNWQAVLWHEFCHVVTLNKTNNKMPRWLSEGISVYEERQASGAWGQSMTPEYKQMILQGELTPVSQLSAAFLKPPTPLHLQFAYFESSLVVEHLIAKYGLDALKKVLDDLAIGMPINEALGRHAGSIEILDREFAAFARERAEQFAPTAEWSEPRIPPRASASEIGDWVTQQPSNVRGWLRYGKKLVEDRQWAAAVKALEQALELAPDYIGEGGGAYAPLAEAFRQAGDTSGEKTVLNEWVSRDADALSQRIRLGEICLSEKDFHSALEHAQRAMAINPLIPGPHRLAASAAEALGARSEAIEACRALLQLSPADPAGLNHQLARLLLSENRLPEARRHALVALEKAPRYRDAHRTLLEIVARRKSASEPVEPPAPEYLDVIEPPAPEPPAPQASTSPVEDSEIPPTESGT